MWWKKRERQWVESEEDSSEKPLPRLELRGLVLCLVLFVMVDASCWLGVRICHGLIQLVVCVRTRVSPRGEE